MGARLEPIIGRDGAGRNETQLERCDRNLVELMQEVRVVQTGVQVRFAFLLTAPLAPRFPELSSFQKLTYFATLLAAGAAAVLLIAPTAYHRILCRLGDKEHLVQVGALPDARGLAHPSHGPARFWSSADARASDPHARAPRRPAPRRRPLRLRGQVGGSAVSGAGRRNRGLRRGGRPSFELAAVAPAPDPARRRSAAGRATSSESRRGSSAPAPRRWATSASRAYPTACVSPGDACIPSATMSWSPPTSPELSLDPRMARGGEARRGDRWIQAEPPPVSAGFLGSRPAMRSVA